MGLQHGVPSGTGATVVKAGLYVKQLRHVGLGGHLHRAGGNRGSGGFGGGLGGNGGFNNHVGNQVGSAGVLPVQVA